ALEHDRDPDDPGHEHSREGRLGRPRRRPTAGAPASDPLSDRGKHVQEHEHEQKRLHERANHELGEVLAQDHQVAQHERHERRAAGGEGGARWLDRDACPARGGWCGGGGHQSRSSLPVRLMKTVSRLGSDTDRSASSKPAASAALTTRGTRRSASLTCSSTPPSITRVFVTSEISPASRSASACVSPSARTVTIVSAPTERLSASGLSRARILP